MCGVFLRGVECAGFRRDREVPRKVAAERMARVEEDAVAFRHVPPHGAGDHVARRKLLAWCHFNEASAGLVPTSIAPSPRTASLTRVSGEASVSSAVGWNCTNSMSTSTAPARGQCETLAECAARIGAVQEQPTHAAGCDHHASCR
jgi:hypothetical protein